MKTKGINMYEKIKELLKIVQGAWGYVVLGVIVIILTNWFTGSAVAKTLNESIDIRIDQRIELNSNNKILPILKEMQKDMSFMVETAYSTYNLTIEKQIEKIRKDPNDIKKADIEDILQKWKSFPEERKTDDLVMKYECIKQWYARNQ